MTTRRIGRWTCWWRPTPRRRVQEAVFFAAADLLNLEVDLLFFDTTSTFFERDERGRRRRCVPRFGHSKDHRPDLPQVVIGLAVTREGIPVRVWCWPGNTNDMTVLKQVKDDLRGWRLGRVVTVVDRGFSSDDNLAYLTRAGGHWIAGERMRDGTADVAQVLSRQGRYQSVRDNLRVKEVRVGQRRRGPPVRRSATTPTQADRDRAQREQQLAAGRRPSWSASPALRAKAAKADRPSAAAAGRRPPQGRVRAARPPHPRPLAAPDPRRAAGRSTAPRSRPRRGWTASSCCPPATPTCRPRTSRWATRTCWRPSAASAT